MWEETGVSQRRLVVSEMENLPANVRSGRQVESESPLLLALEHECKLKTLQRGTNLRDPKGHVEGTEKEALRPVLLGPFFLQTSERRC